LDQCQDVGNVVTGVNDHPFMRGFIADDRAVALQRADGDDFMNHD